jgi:hypothetical protein
MRKIMLGVLMVSLIIPIFISCVSLEHKTLVGEQREKIETIGTVTAQFTSFQLFNFPIGVKSTAYKELLKEARTKYSGDVDVVNITIEGEGSLLSLLTPGLTSFIGIYAGMFGTIFEESWGVPLLGSGFGIIAVGNFQDITAKGDVIRLTDSTRELLGKREAPQKAPQKNAASFSDKALTTAINNSYEQLSTTLLGSAKFFEEEKTKIAVISIAASSASDSEFLIEELNRLLVNSLQFAVVDRRSLDAIRTEQNFQTSGEVDDDQVVGIGKMAGANIVITGNITTSGKTSRLRLKALDVKTAEIVAMSSEIIQ